MQHISYVTLLPCCEFFKDKHEQKSLHIVKQPSEEFFWFFFGGPFIPSLAVKFIYRHESRHLLPHLDMVWFVHQKKKVKSTSAWHSKRKNFKVWKL